MTKQNRFGVGCPLILAALVLSSIGIFHPQALTLALALFVGLMILVVACLEVVSRLKIRSLRSQGLYPPADKAALEDVKALMEALVEAKEKLNAIQLYRKIYRVSLQDALRAIDRIQNRSTNVN